eukprot:28402-Pleurochrysis_carterae.AAC.2
MRQGDPASSGGTQREHSAPTLSSATHQPLNPDAQMCQGVPSHYVQEHVNLPAYPQCPQHPFMHWTQPPLAQQQQFSVPPRAGANPMSFTQQIPPFFDQQIYAGYMLAVQQQAGALGTFNNGGHSFSAQQLSVGAHPSSNRPPPSLAAIKARLVWESKKREDLLESQALNEYYTELMGVRM